MMKMNVHNLSVLSNQLGIWGLPGTFMESFVVIKFKLAVYHSCFREYATTTPEETKVMSAVFFSSGFI